MNCAFQHGQTLENEEAPISKVLIAQRMIQLIENKFIKQSKSGDVLNITRWSILMIFLEIFGLKEIKILANSYDCQIIKPCIFILLMAREYPFVVKNIRDRIYDDFSRGYSLFQLVQQTDKPKDFLIKSAAKEKGFYASFIDQLYTTYIQISKLVDKLTKEEKNHFNLLRNFREKYRDDLNPDFKEKIKTIHKEELLRAIFADSLQENQLTVLSSELVGDQKFWFYSSKFNKNVQIYHKTCTKFLKNSELKKFMCYQLQDNRFKQYTAEFCFEYPSWIEIDSNNDKSSQFDFKKIENIPTIIASTLTKEMKKSRMLMTLFRQKFDESYGILVNPDKNCLVLSFQRDDSLQKIKEKFEEFLGVAKSYFLQKIEVFSSNDGLNMAYNSEGKIKELLKQNECLQVSMNGSSEYSNIMKEIPKKWVDWSYGQKLDGLTSLIINFRRKKQASVIVDTVNLNFGDMDIRPVVSNQFQVI